MASNSTLVSCPVVDDSFGPWAGSCRGGFDFTLLFEESILSLLPLSLLLLAAPFRLLHLSKRSIKVVQSPLLPIKLFLFVVFGALNLANLILWATPSAVRTKVSLPLAILTFVGSLLLCLLAYAEHVRSVEPSVLLNFYLGFSLLFDTARTRTLWLQQYNRTIAIIFTAIVAVKTVLLVLEVWEKRKVLRPEYKGYPPESTSGIFNKFFFYWLNSLLRTGHRKLLGVDDLFVLDKFLAADYIGTTLQAAWEKVTNPAPNTLLAVTVGKVKWPLIAGILPRLCLTGFMYCQPFLINLAIDLSEQPVTEETTNYGYGLIGAYIVVYVGIAVSMGQHQHLTYRAITMMRGGLISLLYNKTTDLGVSAVDPAAALTLMSADIERIYTGWQTIHEIWANVLEVGLAIFLLERQLGAAAAIPVAVAFVSMVGSSAATSFIMSRQAMWLEAIEKRVAATASMLASMKGVKMCGLTETLKKNLQDLRVEEIRVSKRFRKLLIWNMGFTFITPVAAPILTFAVFSVMAQKSGDYTLDTARVFTSLSLFTLLAEPLASLIMSLATFMGSVGCYRRIQKFLLAESREDTRATPATTAFDKEDKEYQSSETNSSSPPSELEKQLNATMHVPDDMYSSHAEAISVRNGSFGWDKEKEPQLRSITMTVPRARLTMLVGPVGCGKSTLVKALLGEVPTIAGSVQLSSLKIAYCDQTAWHTNSTIQESITFFQEFDETWYNTVIRACALDEDLKQLPQGDQTQIGSNGIALSGGQSQRIALARAVYAKKSIVVLDDALSGLDADTENRVFHNLLGKQGIFRQHNATVLVASSAAKRLPYADHIIALSGDGTIAEQGSFKELNSTGGYIASFSLPMPDWEYNPEVEEEAIKESPVVYKYDKFDPNAAVEQAAADASRQTGDVAIYLYYIQSVGWIPTLIFVGAITAFTFCISFPTVWVKWWATANDAAPNQNLGYYLGIYGMLGAIGLFFLIVSCWQMIITMVPLSGERFHWKLLTTVLNAPMSFFATTDNGVTVNRFSQDLQLIDMELPISALNTFATFVLCIAQMVLIAVASTYAAIAFPIFLLILYFIQSYYLRTSRQLRFLDIEAKSPLYSQFVECLSGLITVRAFGYQSSLLKQNKTLLDRSQRPFYLLFAVQRWLTVVLDLLVAVIATMLAVLVVKMRGTMNSGFVGIALLNVILFSQSIKLLVTYWTMLETHIGSIARIKNFTSDTTSEHLEGEDVVPKPDWPENGQIEFRNVSAAYKKDEPVLNNISLTISSGEKVGIVGRTGSGKSSLVSCLFRMLELSSGSIYIDGLDISTIQREEIRSRIIGVPQEAYLLTGSVRLNADPLGISKDEEIIEALKDVRLWSKIEEKSKEKNERTPLDMEISEVFLSHGQRQLFCLARAMLRKSTILVLDETTSSVDTPTDSLIQSIIRTKFSSHTIISIAHKLDTILDFDKVALLSHGELVEYENPYTLLAKGDSAFAKLYSQVVAEEDSESDGSSGGSAPVVVEKDDDIIVAKD